MDIKEKTQGFSIKDKSVCIIGCGGLGSNIAVHLSGAGAGKIFLCDFDTVSESNLNRQFLFTPSDIGSEKCQVIKKRLSAFSPETEFASVNKRITHKEDLSFAKECDILVCAVDNAKARNAVAEFSLSENIPSVYGGIDSFYGTAYLFIPEKSPCPYCAGMITESPVGFSVSSTAGIIGSMQANLTLKYLLTEDTSLSGKIYLFDGDLWETLSVRTNSECKKCNLSEVVK